MSSLPYPVPQAIADEADALGGSSSGPGKAVSSPVFVINLLAANGDILFSSPPLTGKQLKVYVYEFNVAVNPLKWRIRLDLSWTYRDVTYRFSSTFYVDTPTVTPRGDGARIRITGNSKSATSASNSLKRRLVSSVQRGNPGISGFSSSRPLRPNESVSEPFTDKIWNRPNSTTAWNTGDIVVAAHIKYSRTWTGSRTPGFGGTQARRLPVNAHTVSMRRTQHPPCYFGSHNVTNGSASGERRRWTKYYPGASTPVHLAQADATALSRLLSRAGQERQNLSESVATIGQTVDMIRGNLDRIVKTLRHLKKGNLQGATESLFGSHNPRYRRRGGPNRSKDLASNWLELQYGWKPLLQDIHWAMEKLSTSSMSDLQVVRTASSAKVRTRASTNVTAVNVASVHGGSISVETLSHTKYVIYWRMSDPFLNLLSQAGFTNPISLGWELLPFSFVVDWLYPLGPFFEQLSAWEGLTFLSGSKTQFTKQWTDSGVDYNAVHPLNASVRIWGRGAYHDEWIILNRTKLTAFPGPSVIPVKNPLSSLTRVANLLALVQVLAK